MENRLYNNKEKEIYINLLDKMRKELGQKYMIDFYEKLLKEKNKYAIELINDTNLSFYSFFLLKPIIENSDIRFYLNTRNMISLEIIDEISHGSKKLFAPENLTSEYIILVVLSLRWIVATGLFEGYENEYLKIIDKCVILLIKIYKDISLTPIIIENIFERNRKNYFTYDLIWAFFHLRNPLSLIYIARYFFSKNDEDIELANKLLSSITNIDFNRMKNIHQKYLVFLNWLQENKDFILFTGESFQKRSDPQPYIVVLEAKYLCKPISINTGKSFVPLNEYEKTLLSAFNQLDNSTKHLLANYSYKLYCNSKKYWHKWIRSSIPQQILIARMEAWLR